MQQRFIVIGLAALVCAGPACAQQYYRQPPAYAQPVYAQPPVYTQPRQVLPPQMSPPQVMAQATPRMVVVTQPQRMQARMGGGFIEYLFGSDDGQPRNSPPEPTIYSNPPANAQPVYGNPAQDARNYDINPIYERQEVFYETAQEPGSVVIDTPNKFLYLVQPGGRALRYGIGVGRPGFTWSGVHKVSAKKEWPDWTPPDEMLQRQPYLPHFMPGGPNNPLGARAMYLGSTLYRIHGSNEPWTIGTNVSSGCIRMRNADVIDLYERVRVGAKVTVL